MNAYQKSSLLLGLLIGGNSILKFFGLWRIGFIQPWVSISIVVGLILYLLIPLESKSATELAPQGQLQRRSNLRLGIALTMTVLALSVILLSRGRFAQSFSEFDTELSTMTYFAMSPFLPGILVANLTVSLLTGLSDATGSKANVCSTIAIIMVLACALFYLAGMFLPLWHLLNGLS